MFPRLISKTTLIIGRKVVQPVRQCSTSEMKKARAARVASASSGDSGSILSVSRVVGFSAIIGFGYCIFDIAENPTGSLGKLYKGSVIESTMKAAYAKTIGNFDDIFDPSGDNLIPVWPTDPAYGNPPPGAPAPPLLVIDVEKTLVGSVYDAQMGWRHVKRPGVDKFLNAMVQYYEIVLFSENDAGVAQDIFQAIDPENRCHRLGANAAEIRGTAVIKRLDCMGRDLARIILIDDSEVSSQMFPRNTLLVKPYTNIKDTTDSAISDLIPLLHAIVHDDVQDFRNTLDNLGTHEASEAVLEYSMRLSEKREQALRKRNRGLGGIIRSSLPSLAVEDDPDPLKRSNILSPTQIVGTSMSDERAEMLKLHSTQKKPSTKKKGAFFAGLDSMESEKEEHDRRKQEKMNDIYQKRQIDKMQQAKAEQDRKQQEADERLYK